MEPASLRRVERSLTDPLRTVTTGRYRAVQSEADGTPLARRVKNQLRLSIVVTSGFKRCLALRALHRDGSAEVLLDTMYTRRRVTVGKWH